MGPRGKFVVAGFAIFEFFGGSCLTLMVLWRQVITILPADGGAVCSLLPTTTLALPHSQPQTQHCTILCCRCLLRSQRPRLRGATGLWGYSSLQVGVAFSIAALTPVLLLPSFTKISSLAFMGCLSTILVVLVAIGTVADDPLRHRMPLQASSGPATVADAAALLPL